MPPEKQNKELLTILTKFAVNYKSSIDGAPRHIDTDHVPGSVRIVHVFEDVFARDLNAINPIENLSHQDILIAIRRSGGTESKFIIPEVAFRDLVKTQIKRLELPAINCAENVYVEMRKIIDLCVAQSFVEMRRFPRIREAIVALVEDMLKQQLAEVKSMLKKYVEVEASYVATSRKQFNVDEETQFNVMDVAGAQINCEQIENRAAAVSWTNINFTLNVEINFPFHNKKNRAAHHHQRLVHLTINSKSNARSLNH